MNSSREVKTSTLLFDTDTGRDIRKYAPGLIFFLRG